MTTLVEIKAVDELYPLYGIASISTSGTALAGALAAKDGLPGIAVDPQLLARLDVAVGSRVKIGTGEFEVRDTIAREPDRISDGIVFGPRVIMSLDGLANDAASSSRAASSPGSTG